MYEFLAPWLLTLSFGGGGGSSPPPPPPPPADDSAQQMEREKKAREARAEALARGRASTILAGRNPLGEEDDPRLGGSVAKKRLLGG